jgi:FRG domain
VMVRPLEIRVENWQGLVDLDGQINNPFAMNPSFLFRGQARAEWFLVPSFLRVAEDNDLTVENSLRLEEALLGEFRTGAHLYLPPSVLPQDPRDMVTMLAGMQHYGAPTRLLDWTESLYVAMYFAVEKELDHDGAVWVIHPRTIRDAFGIDEGWSCTFEDIEVFRRQDAPPTLFTIRSKHQTERMSAQQTVFTVSPQIMARHDPILEKAHAQSDEPERHRYLKIIVPRELKLDFLSRLHRVNITARALFPGIDGIGRAMAELLRRDAAAFKKPSS